MIGTSIDRIAAAVEEEFDRLKVARPALLSRIKRAEDIIVTHLSCKRASIIRPRIRGGELVGYLVKGSGASGAVYRVEPKSFSCSCPDYHRSGLKGCKHGIACYALGRAFRPSAASAPQTSRRCAVEPKRLRQRHEAVSESTVAALEREEGHSTTVDSYGEASCSRCLDGQTYDEREGWVACERCEGTGRVLAFLYERAQRRLYECVGCGRRYPHRELIEVGDDNLTFFEGDLLCHQGCAGAHGVL